MITIKNFISAPTRLQWMLLCLQPYEHGCCILARQGDTPGIHPISGLTHITFCETCLSQIRKETANCLVLSVVYCLNHHSWPVSCWHVPNVAWHYWDMCNKLHPWGHPVNRVLHHHIILSPPLRCPTCRHPWGAVSDLQVSTNGQRPHLLVHNKMQHQGSCQEVQDRHQSKTLFTCWAFNQFPQVSCRKSAQISKRRSKTGSSVRINSLLKPNNTGFPLWVLFSLTYFHQRNSSWGIHR